MPRAQSQSSRARLAYSSATAARTRRRNSRSATCAHSLSLEGFSMQRNVLSVGQNLCELVFVPGPLPTFRDAE